ncbi:MAG: tetratricopeptide repeat protein [Fusobacteriaceae bacterium]
MKKRKFTVILAMLFGVGCSNLQMITEQSRPAPNVQDLRFSPDQSVSQNTRVFNRETAFSQIEDIKATVRERRERAYLLDSRDSTYEIYVGEYLKLPAGSVTKFSLLNTDKKLYDSRIAEGYYYFRSIYQGNYNIRIDFQNGTTKVIRVVNKMKYRFTEGETYGIIRDSYNSGQYKDVLEFVDLHTMAFKESQKNLELGFMVLDIYMNNGNYAYAKEKIAELKKENNLSSRDISALFNYEISLNPNYNVEKFYIENSRYNRGLDFSLREYLGGKSEMTSQEADFMGVETQEKKNQLKEEIVVDKRISSEIKTQNAALIQSEEILKNEIKEKKPAWDNSESEGKKQYENGKTAYERGRYNEATLLLNRAEKSGVREADISYYLADSYFKIENYDKAVENYKKYFKSSEEGIRKAESYYNCGIAYEKLGKKEEAISTFRKVMELFPGTSWARKANIYIVRLKN